MCSVSALRGSPVVSRRQDWEPWDSLGRCADCVSSPQCIRQVTNNPVQESLDRVWLLLSLCVVSFPPGKILFKVRSIFLLARYITLPLKNGYHYPILRHDIFSISLIGYMPCNTLTLNTRIPFITSSAKLQSCTSC